MIDAKLLWRATLVGIVLQVAMVVIGHFEPWVALHVFMFGGMFISGVAGLLYARDFGRGYGLGALGGAIAGGVCAFIGIAISVALKDTAQFVLALGTSISVLTGAAGGLWGQWGANIRARANGAR